MNFGTTFSNNILIKTINGLLVQVHKVFLNKKIYYLFKKIQVAETVIN